MAITNQERLGKALDLLRQALAYNGLVQSWPEIARLASEGRTVVRQAELFEPE